MGYLEDCDSQCLSAASYQLLREHKTMIEDKLSEEYKDFLCYISTKSENNSTWKFWKEFVFWDGFSHLCLFFSISGGMWNLRTASIKTMAPMFTAFVRPHYRKLIPQHLKTCWQCLNLSSTSFEMEPLCAAFCHSGWGPCFLPPRWSKTLLQYVQESLQLTH